MFHHFAKQAFQLPAIVSQKLRRPVKLAGIQFFFMIVEF